MQRPTSRKQLTTCAGLAALVLMSPTAHAASPAQELVGPDPFAVNEVGTDVAAFGGYLAASSPFENEFTVTGGPPSFESRVRLFNQANHVRDYYIPHFCPTHSGGGSRNTLAIGARGLVLGLPTHNCSGTSGSAIVYKRQGSDYATSHTFLTPPAGLPANARYGDAVATHGDWIAIGAPGAFGSGLPGGVDMWRWNGTAFVRHGWLPNPAGLPVGGRFGVAVAIHEDLMIVGAPDINMFYVYQREQGIWVLRGQYQGTAPTGNAVDITSSYLVSSKDSTVTVYRRVWNGWVPHQIITHPQFPGAPWGTDVAIDQHRLVLGTGIFQSVAIYGLQGNYVHLGNMQFNLAGGSGELSELPRIGFAVAIDNDDVIAGDPNARYTDSTDPTGAIFFQKYWQVY